MMRRHFLALGTIAFMSLAPQAFAATAINVIEDGEGGGPMSLKLDKSIIKAGEVVFSVHNAAMTEEHEMVLVKLKSAGQKLPLMESRHRIDEKQLKNLGEVADLKPGANGSLKARLSPGHYMLFCNIMGHYEAGMHETLTVTK
ncbi:copper resistance protein [Agrobacterium sp. Ap1]|nr:copper resistance protein [Agrobacterium sp. Ap1]